MDSININRSFERLYRYCESQDYKGWDPYDGLNSTLFQSLPIIRKNRLARLAWIQLFKRNPLNLRSLTGVKKDYNPKGLGLFLHGYCNLYRIEKKEAYLQQIHQIAEKLIALRSQGFSGNCWGYNFDWQARAFFQPKYTPTVVATTFIATALMEAYEVTGHKPYLDIALDTKDFVLKDLNRTYDKDDDFSFSYSPEDSTQVFNASLLGSRLLSQIYKYTGEASLLTEAAKSVRFCCKHQQVNGAWAYGTLPFHQWVDNFHTGYNLECIHAYQRISGDTSFDQNLNKGLQYYLETFFTEEGIPKYYNNQVYPIDIHTTSQLIITISELKKFKEHQPLIDKVLHWTIQNMQDKRGYFYYQLKKNFNSKIPYIRWAQAWMFYSLTVYFFEEYSYSKP
jgi:rhamnogalacturonyl hydrolase YesR